MKRRHITNPLALLIGRDLYKKKIVKKFAPYPSCKNTDSGVVIPNLILLLRSGAVEGVAEAVPDPQQDPGAGEPHRQQVPGGEVLMSCI